MGKVAYTIADTREGILEPPNTPFSEKLNHLTGDDC